MYLNCYLCETCCNGQNFRDEEIIKERVCEKCNNLLHWSRTIEYDENNQMVREFVGDKVHEYKTPPKIQPSPTKPTITCPYCQSTNCKKISGMSRWTSTGLFGLASGKLGKQWHCNSCSSDF